MVCSLNIELGCRASLWSASSSCVTDVAYNDITKTVQPKLATLLQVALNLLFHSSIDIIASGRITRISWGTFFVALWHCDTDVWS